ncbi:signal peptidase I [Rathayibacter soli]|uniref:signal peptidase I n=1 Tax=Rathayibacter soli TaxID=3144168 RepID=UPI0027E50126|nr:signal peptidase I [Glaciibacter superstes]
MTISLHSASTDTTQPGARGSTAEEPAEEQSEAKRRGVLHFIGVGLSAGALTLVLAFAAILIVVPWVAGATPMTILTSSMEPTLPPGTLIVVKPEPISDIRIGDVMTYQFESGKPAVVSHRVISESVRADGARTFITKGDNNAVADPNPVVAGQVRGVVWYSIPWIGYASTAINGSNRSWIVPAIAVVLIGYAGYMILGGVLEARKKRRAAAASLGE